MNMRRRRRLSPERRLGLMLGGIVLFGFIAIGATVALPAADPVLAQIEPGRDFDEAATHGMQVYRAEGCWYCHTMQSRDVTSDEAFGDPITAEELAEQQPSMVGFERIGPDLSRVGSRYEDAGELIAELRRPRREGRMSSMPSYAHLSRAELEALAAYLLSLE